MSDEYGRQQAFNKDSLVDESMDINPDGRTADEKFKNYPPEGNTTSSGGYSTSPDMWSDRAQRGNPVQAVNEAGTKREFGVTEVKGSGANENGLIDQSLSGGNLQDEMGDVRPERD